MRLILHSKRDSNCVAILETHYSSASFVLRAKHLVVPRKPNIIPLCNVVSVLLFIDEATLVWTPRESLTEVVRAEAQYPLQSMPRYAL